MISFWNVKSTYNLRYQVSFEINTDIISLLLIDQSHIMQSNITLIHPCLGSLILVKSNETNSNPPPVKLLPPYPSSVATKKSRRKSLNIDKVDGRLKRRHSVKN